MSKIIFVNRYYRPDHSATAQLLTDLAEHLVAGGSSVTIVTSRLRYLDANANLPPRQTLEGVNIYRIKTSKFGRIHLIGRAIDYLSFYIGSFFKLISIVKHGDILVIKTDPPMLSVIGAIVAKIKRATLINWLQDLFPEVAHELGIHIPSPILSTLKSMRNWSLRAAKYNVVLGELMAEHINSCTGGLEKTLVIPNWAIASKLQPIAACNNSLREQWGLTGKFVVGYSGNLGRAHDYHTIHRAATELRNDTNIVFLFVGDGAGILELRKLCERDALTNMIFKPYQSIEHLNLSLAAADVHWVTLNPNLEGLIVPSKAYGIFAVGRPLLFIGSTNGELGRLVHRNNCGYSIEPGDFKALTDFLLQIKSDANKVAAMSENSRTLYECEFKYGNSLAKWHRILTPRQA